MSETVSLQAEIQHKLDMVQTYVREASVLAKANEMIGSVNLDCCQYICVSAYSDGTANIVFHLKEESKDVRLASQLAHILGVKFEKRQDWTGESLTASGTKDRIEFRVRGYVPATCKIEEIETPLSEEEYEERCKAALANVRRVSVERKIVCKEVK